MAGAYRNSDTRKSYVEWCECLTKNRRLIDVFLEEKKTLLDATQFAALEHFLHGGSGCISGPGGTGKSFLIRMLVDFMSNTLGLQVGVTATTGQAAVDLCMGAETIHRFVGGIIWNKPLKDMIGISRSRRSGALRARWTGVQVLIIDEVGRLSPRLFEKFASFAQNVRGCNQPFGGLQLICSGDWAQIVPIEKDPIPDDQPTFCFESEVFLDCIHRHEFILNTPFRQNEDLEYYEFLQQIRVGRVTKECDAMLRSRLNMEIEPPLDKFACIKLFSTNSMVEGENMERLQELKTPEHVFRGEFGVMLIDKFTSPLEIDSLKQELEKNLRVPEVCVLKEGAAVVLVYNADVSHGLANGSQGIVVGFTKNGLPIVDFVHQKDVVICKQKWYQFPVEDALHPKNPKDMCCVFYEQVPLILGFAITIHRSQGMSLDCAEIDIGRSVFAFGQAYTALSRVRTFKGLKLMQYCKTSIKAHPKVIALETRTQENGEQSQKKIKRDQ
jgi:ATP-dependent DNA helicase PIF1